MRRIMFIITVVLSLNAHAQDLGVYGAIYPISEPDMLTMLHQKLVALKKSGQLAVLEAAAKKRVIAHILRPVPVKGVVNATRNRTFYYTPQLILQHDITDLTGHILFAKGTRINALDPRTVKRINPYAVVPRFDETLLFINADDPVQVAYAKKIKAHVKQLKIILTKGAINKAAAALGRVYFDQAGTLVHKFGIHAVPALVSLQGVRLRIREVSVMTQANAALTKRKYA